MGCLRGLQGETWTLDWNRKRKGLLVSAVNQTVCVWDAEKNI